MKQFKGNLGKIQEFADELRNEAEQCWQKAERKRMAAWERWAQRAA